MSLLNVWIVGGGDLAGQFADAGLLDEVLVTVAPVTLGAGALLLPRPAPSRSRSRRGRRARSTSTPSAAT